MKANDWRPIETVTKGITVLLFSNNTGLINLGSYCAYKKNHFVIYDDDEQDSVPTYWMPLPKRPTKI